MVQYLLIMCHEKELFKAKSVQLRIIGERGQLCTSFRELPQMIKIGLLDSKKVRQNIIISVCYTLYMYTMAVLFALPLAVSLFRFYYLIFMGRYMYGLLVYYQHSPPAIRKPAVVKGREMFDAGCTH